MKISSKFENYKKIIVIITITADTENFVKVRKLLKNVYLNGVSATGHKRLLHVRACAFNVIEHDRFARQPGPAAQNVAEDAALHFAAIEKYGKDQNYTFLPSAKKKRRCLK